LPAQKDFDDFCDRDHRRRRRRRRQPPLNVKQKGAITSINLVRQGSKNGGIKIPIMLVLAETSVGACGTRFVCCSQVAIY
jgi:hypothetical protein